MKMKCSFSWEGKPEQSLEMCWQTRPVRPSLHTIRLLFSSDSPSFQCTEMIWQPGTTQHCYRALEQLLHFTPEASLFKWQENGFSRSSTLSMRLRRSWWPEFMMLHWLASQAGAISLLVHLTPERGNIQFTWERQICSLTLQLHKRLFGP